MNISEKPKMNSKEWSSNQAFRLHSPSLQITAVIFFMIIVMFSVVSCKRKDPFLVCGSDDCSFSSSVTGFVEIKIQNRKSLKKLTKSGLLPVNIVAQGKNLLAFCPRSKSYLLRGLDKYGYKLEIFDADTEKLKKVELPGEISSILSACFDGSGRIWFLSVKDHPDMPRKFILSKSDPQHIEWTNYLIREETEESWLERIFTLGLPIERPASLTCGEDGSYIITHQYFQDMMRINVYLFDDVDRSLRYVSSFFPVDESGKVSTYYSIKNSTLFVFQNSELHIVHQNQFPETILFDDEKGEMVFAEEDGKPVLMFIPGKRVDGKIAGRLVENLSEIVKY